MTADLTALISYKQGQALSKSRTVSYLALSEIPTKSKNKKQVYSPNADSVRNSTYKSKCNILRIVETITKDLRLLKTVKNPVNLLYSEIVNYYRSNPTLAFSTNTDDEFHEIVFKILVNYAHYTEYFYRYEWEDTTCEFSPERKRNFRNKLDKFLWRIHNRISSLLELQTIAPDLNVQLALLSAYMKHCPSQVMASQVVEVMMELLLKIKVSSNTLN